MREKEKLLSIPKYSKINKVMLKWYYPLEFKSVDESNLMYTDDEIYNADETSPNLRLKEAKL